MCYSSISVQTCRVTLLFLVLIPSTSVADERDEFFESKIRPVLIDRCYDCHSQDSDSVMGGLRLDHRGGWEIGGDSGPAVVPGKPSRSLLFQAVDPDQHDMQMPPDDPLPAAIVSDIRKWIEDGAVDPRETRDSAATLNFDLATRRANHWAWQPRQEVFQADADIDFFIDRQLKKQGLAIAPQANAHALLRRLYLDLVGLPPTLDDISRFTVAWEINREQAITSEVDRLLADSRFGEHWARHWLDVVRYSETKGHVTDQERPFAWKYRDYMIDALNDDLPYDRLVMEHLAGDLLPVDAQRSGLRGETNVTATPTGFLFMHEMHFMAVDPIKQRWDEINAQIDVVGKAFLGLTLECVRCHDHKFDAISQRDYYALAGFFYSTEQGTHRTAPRTADHVKDLAAMEAAEVAYADFLRNKRAARKAAQQPKAGGQYFPVSDELGIQSPGDTNRMLSLMKQLDEADPSWQYWVRSAVDVLGTDVELRIRGEHDKPGERIPRRFLEAIPTSTEPKPEELGSGSGRQWLAQQIASEKNPLTARVWVNRIWHHLLGQGLVKSPNNFGVMGGSPSHPELLDFLAATLIESGWSTKAIIRRIVLSRVYQRSDLSILGDDAQSELTPEASARATELDPENRWLSYRRKRRLTGEQLRDSMLAVAGSLNPASHGPSIACYVPPYVTANKRSNVPKSGPLDGDNRRSIYIQVRRNFAEPFLSAFDFPDPGKSIGRRTVTQSSRQALALMNGPLVHELAADWAKRLAKAGEPTPKRIARLFLKAVNRPPTTTELELLAVLDAQLKTDATNEQRWKNLAHVMFNHPEFLFVP